MPLDQGSQIDSPTRPALQELPGCRDERPRREWAVWWEGKGEEQYLGETGAGQGSRAVPGGYRSRYSG